MNSVNDAGLSYAIVYNLNRRAAQGAPSFPATQVGADSVYRATISGVYCLCRVCCAVHAENDHQVYNIVSIDMTREAHDASKIVCVI